MGLKTSSEGLDGAVEGLLEGLGLGDGVGTALEGFGMIGVAVGVGDAGVFGGF